MCFKTESFSIMQRCVLLLLQQKQDCFEYKYAKGERELWKRTFIGYMRNGITIQLKKVYSTDTIRKQG